MAPMSRLSSMVPVHHCHEVPSTERKRTSTCVPLGSGVALEMVGGLVAARGEAAACSMTDSKKPLRSNTTSRGH